MKCSLPDMTRLLYSGTHSRCNDLRKTSTRSSQSQSQHREEAGKYGTTPAEELLAFERILFFNGYSDTGRLPIVFLKVSSALLKHLAINMGEEKIYFSLQPSGHTSLPWEVRAGT